MKNFCKHFINFLQVLDGNKIEEEKKWAKQETGHGDTADMT